MVNFQLNKLLEKFFSSSITKSQYNELRDAADAVSDDMLSKELEDVWQKSDFSNSMPHYAKSRVKADIDRAITKRRWLNVAAKSYRVAAAVLIPLLLVSTIYLVADRNKILNRKADLLDVYVARGEKASITLPDGSTVMLNSESRLTYPSNFSSRERWIKLDGEAYFHVKKNHGRSFTVKTGKMDVRVLGTTFNVSAYSSEHKASVVLVNGSVAASTPGEEPVLIKPNEMFTVDTKTGVKEVSEVNVYNYTCWRQGILNFDSESVASVLEKLSRQFNVVLEYDKARFGNDKISGKLDLNEGIEAALQTISLATPVSIKKYKNRFLITPR